MRRFYRLDDHREQALVYRGHDPCVCVLSMGALVQLMRGELGQSRSLSDEAIALAARVGHVPSVAHAAWYRAELGHILGDVAEAETRARETLAVASEKGIAHYAAWAVMLDDYLPTVTVPTLVVVGTADALTPPRDSRRIAALVPNAKLVEYEGGGHMLMYERTGELDALIMDFADACQAGVREADASGSTAG